MSTERCEPDALTPGELDDYLARGWYRIGHGLITTDLLTWGAELRTTLWTRLDVRGHRFTSSVRKLMARNGRRFRVRVGGLVMDDARDQLYARYLAEVGGDRAESLVDVVGGERGRALFDTREISVWSEDRLVAFSWYDLGARSVQSLIGVYDPAFGKHSLGLYTMLLEIQETAALGKHYHYAGYVLAVPSSMDYKLRAGSLQFFDPETSRWRHAPPYERGGSPAEILTRKSDAAEDALRRAGVEAFRYLNPSLKIRGLLEQVPRCPTQPLFLVCGAAGHARAVLVAWEHRLGAYLLTRARAVVATLTRGAEAPPMDLLLFVIEAELGERESVEEVVDLTQAELGAIDRR